MSQSFQCPNCNAPLDFPTHGESVVICNYCRSKVVLPKELLSDSISNQFVMTNLLQPDQVAKLGEIKNLVAEGNKIAAIKLYREVFDTSLTEAKESVERLADGEAVTVTQVSVLTEGEALQTRNDLAEAEIRQLLQDGKKIEAIKHYRETYHTGLKDSKDAIEVFETSGVLPTPSYEMGVENAQEMMDAIQKLTQSTSAESISTQTSSVGIPTRRADRVRVGSGWWISCVVVFILLTVILPILAAMTSRGGPLEVVWARINPFAYSRVNQVFGEEGSGPGLIDDPRGLAIDDSGNLYVANYSDGRIQKFDPSGDFIFLWSVGSEGIINSLAADRFGNIFVVYQGEIQRFDSATGKPTGRVENPDDRWFDVVAASPDGSLVAAGNTEDIVRFDVEGRQVFSRAESSGVFSSQAEDVEDITVDAVGNIYVLSDSSASVLKYTPDGRLLTRFGSEGEEEGQFDLPYSIAVDGQGRIYVSDIDGISVFASDGRYLDEFNVPGGVAFGIEFDDRGNLWAVTNQPKVLKFKVPSQ